MKLLAVFIFGILFFTFIPSVFATFEDDYQGYLKTYDAYRAQHGTYITTRNQYLQYGTLTSKNDALVAVKNLLSARDDVLLSYISLLRLRLADATYNSLLDDHFTFISEHKSKVPVIGSLEDAVNSAGEIEGRHVSMQSLSRKIVGSLSLAKIDGLKVRFLLLETEASTIIEQLRSQGKDVTTLDRWLLDAKNKRLLAEEKLRVARNQIDSFTSLELDDLAGQFNGALFTLFEANQYLREGAAFLAELKESIKYGNY